MIPEMAKRLESGEELHLLVSPKSRHLHQGYGPNVFYITYPWSNERRTPAHALASTSTRRCGCRSATSTSSTR